MIDDQFQLLIRWLMVITALLAIQVGSAMASGIGRLL